MDTATCFLDSPASRSNPNVHADDACSSGPQGRSEETCSISDLAEISMYVRWGGPSGETKVNRLYLRRIETIDCLQGVSKQLLTRAFPPEERPQHLTSAEFYRYTPVEEFLSLPGTVSHTLFQLVVTTREGWEYVVSERSLGEQTEPSRQLLVTVIEFESTAMFMDGLGLRMSLVAYPVISVRKDFLDDLALQLRTNPSFKGIM